MDSSSSLLSSILDHNRKLAQDIGAVDSFKFDPGSVVLRADKKSLLCKEDGLAARSEEDLDGSQPAGAGSSSSRGDTTASGSPYSFCIADVEKREADSLLSSPHIEYCIFIVRTRDNESRLVRRRYKELHGYYSEMSAHGQVVNSEGLVFPAGGSQLLSSFDNKKDPSGRYVQQRRAELETFFSRLFALNPYLLSHPYTCEFFELNLMPIIDHREHAQRRGRDEGAAPAGSAQLSTPLRDNLFSSIVSLDSSLSGAKTQGRNVYSL